MRSPLLLLLLALTLSTGCAKRVLVKTEQPVSSVVLNGKDIGRVDGAGVTVQVSPGVEPIPYEVHDGERVVTGEIPRDELNGWIVGGSLAAAACCAPTLAAGGACLANPGLAAASVVCLLSGPTVCVTALATPGWLTLPAGALGLALGLSPLGLSFLAEEPKQEVTLPQPQREPEPASAQDPPRLVLEAMPW